MKKLIVCIIALSMSILAMGQGKFHPVQNSDEVTTKLVSAMRNMSTMQSDFTQVKHNMGMASDLKSNGKFYYSKADKVCLDYTTPIKMAIVVNGTKVMMKTGSNTRIMETSSNAILNEMVSVISSCMTGNIQDLKDKYRMQYFQSGTDYLVKVFPSDSKKSKIISEVNITIKKSDMSVVSMKMIEASKTERKDGDHDYTEYIFSNTKLNSAIDANIFAIK